MPYITGVRKMLDVRQRSRLFTEAGGKTRPADTDQHLAVYRLVGVGGKNSPKKQSKEEALSRAKSVRRRTPNILRSLAEHLDVVRQAH